MDSLSLTINFQSTEELQDFLKLIKPKEKKEKKLNDKRGHQTQLLHTIAKEIKQENNETPYKDCLKQAGEKLKTKDIFII